MIHHNDADISIITRNIVASWHHLLSFCCTIYKVCFLFLHSLTSTYCTCVPVQRVQE